MSQLIVKVAQSLQESIDPADSQIEEVPSGDIDMDTKSNPTGNVVKEIPKEADQQLKHDLVKVHDLLMETKEFGFMGVEYATKKDASEKLTVTITFPSPSEMNAMKAQKAANEPSPMPIGAAGQQAAPQAMPTKAQASGIRKIRTASDINVLKGKYPDAFLKTIGF